MPSNSSQKKSDAKAFTKLGKTLACCDGLCGNPLGHAVKEGPDCTVAWLCAAVIFGSQILAEQTEKRWNKQIDNNNRVFLPEDFDLRLQGYQSDDDSLLSHPLPIPVVISSLKNMSAEEKHSLKEVESELKYVIGMLEYIVSRLSSKDNVTLASSRRNGCQEEQGVISTGCFLNLHCGHNNQYSSDERQKLIALIHRLSSDSV